MNHEEREKWLAERKTGIGASEVAGILGLSPWDNPVSIWARKKNLVPEKPDSLRFKVGRKMEGPIAELYAERAGVQLVKPVELFRHETHPLLGTPDRLVAGKEVGVEIKTVDPSQEHQWGEDGSDEIPLYYVTQVASYMALTGYGIWDVAVLFGLYDFRVYRLVRDLDLERMLLNRVSDFWRRYVVGNEEPELDGSEESAAYLAQKYPANRKPMLTATPEGDQLFLTVAELQREYNEKGVRYEHGKNLLKQEIGGADGLVSTFGKVYWKTSKPIEVVDWKGVAEELIGPDVPKVLVEKYTHTRPGSRRFILYPNRHNT